MSRLRGAVVGLGVMGAYHLRVLAGLGDDVELAGAVDPSAERRAAAQRSHPGLRTHASLPELLAAEPLSFVCVATPAALLPSLTLEALDAGLHVLVEKPTAPSELEAVAMRRAAEAAGLVLAVGHVERCNPAVIELKRRLDTGVGGRIVQINARRLSPFPFRESMVGVAMDLATHDVDVIRYLTGREVDRVYAETAHVTATGGEDLLSASLRLDGGVTGVLDVNWVTPAKIRSLSVTAERGMFVVDYLTQDLSFHENPHGGIEWDALAVVSGTGVGDVTHFAFDRREPLRVEWEAFVAAVRGEAAPRASIADGLAAMSVARAIQESGSRHTAIRPIYRDLPDDA